MSNDRNYILDRLKSRNISEYEFNFDKLQAPPLSMFLTPADIEELTRIATSLKLSAKPEERYKLIDNVMRSRGLIKFLSGTNRVTYRHPEFPDILFKVASDSVGMGDNPAEFRNQMILKPFVTKIFEVSPHGTVAIAERVHPITSREEFISVCDDVFELITEWLVGEYILADFGAKYFMNFGVRKGQGVVLLDYPYLYKLDGNKLYCNKPDPKSPTGKCDGVIDYDPGYNFLHCTKCGAVYKAKELEEKIKENEITKNVEGESKMKIMISGGSKGIKGEKFNAFDNENENFKETVSSIKVKTYRAGSTTESVDLSGLERSTTGNFNIRTNKSSNDAAPKVPEVKYVSSSNDEAKVEEKKVEAPKTPVVKESKPVVKQQEKVPYKDKKLSVNGVSTRVASSPFSISEDNRAEAESVQKTIKATGSPVMEIENAIKSIKRNFAKLDIDICKQETVNKVINLLGDFLFEDKELSADIDVDNSVDYLAKKLDGLFVKVMWNSDYEEALERNAENAVEDYKYKLDENSEDEACESTDTSKNEEEKDSYDFSNVQFYSAKRMNLKNLLVDGQDREVIVLLDSDDHYVFADPDSILAADVIDDNIVDDVEIVSKTFLNNLIDTTNKFAEDLKTNETEESNLEDGTYEEVHEEELKSDNYTGEVETEYKEEKSSDTESSNSSVEAATNEFLMNEFGGSNKVEV